MKVMPAAGFLVLRSLEGLKGSNPTLEHTDFLLGAGALSVIMYISKVLEQKMRPDTLIHSHGDPTIGRRRKLWLASHAPTLCAMPQYSQTGDDIVTIVIGHRYYCTYRYYRPALLPVINQLF